MPLDPPPTVTWEQVRDRVGLRQGTDYPDAAAIQAEAERLRRLATGAIEGALEGAFRPVPVDELNELILTVAKAYADRKRAGGNAQAQTTTTEDGAGRPVPRDPLAGVRPILARYTVGMA